MASNAVKRAVVADAEKQVKSWTEHRVQELKRYLDVTVKIDQNTQAKNSRPQK